MWKQGSILADTASRLGFSDGPILKKAEELLRSLHAKGSLKSISDVAQTVLCLDLAATQTTDSFDKETAIKLSGLKKSAYQASLHTIEKMLGLEKALTVSDLCVQLSCMEAKAAAEEILDKYMNQHKMLNDLSHPQYVAAAVYSGCKSLNLKMPKQQFIETSRLKPSQWKELSLEFEKIAISKDSGFKKNKKNDTKNTHEELVTVTEEKIVLKKKDPEEVEEYDVWRQRILNEAYTALNRKEAASEGS